MEGELINYADGIYLDIPLSDDCGTLDHVERTGSVWVGKVDLNEDCTWKNAVLREQSATGAYLTGRKPATDATTPKDNIQGDESGNLTNTSKPLENVEDTDDDGQDGQVYQLVREDIESIPARIAESLAGLAGPRPVATGSADAAVQGALRGHGDGVETRSRSSGFAPRVPVLHHLVNNDRFGCMCTFLRAVSLEGGIGEVDRPVSELHSQSEREAGNSGIGSSGGLGACVVQEADNAVVSHVRIRDVFGDHAEQTRPALLVPVVNSFVIKGGGPRVKVALTRYSLSEYTREGSISFLDQYQQWEGSDDPWSVWFLRHPDATTLPHSSEKP